jgi:hypothetical protein
MANDQGRFMKRNIVASILGIALSVTTAVSSRGQGTVSFDNYITFDGYGARLYSDWGNMNPLPVGAFQINLYYQLGNVVSPMATGTLIATTLIGSGGTGAGYYDGGAVTILDYPSSGSPPAGGITFQVEEVGIGAWAGWWGYSIAYNIPSIATGPYPPIELDIPSFYIMIPEPSSAMLSGLGAATLWILRRRQ